MDSSATTTTEIIIMTRKGCPNKRSRKVHFLCEYCGIGTWRYPSRRGQRFCSISCGAKHRAGDLGKKSIGNTWGSRRAITQELRDKLSKAHKGQRRVRNGVAKLGAKNPNWNGGVTPVNKRIRKSAEFAVWRKAVFERDDYTCQFCGKRGVRLHPDHIKQFAYYPELRFDVSNGRTLCEECHKQTPTFGSKGIRRRNQK